MLVAADLDPQAADAEAQGIETVAGVGGEEGEEMRVFETPYGHSNRLPPGDRDPVLGRRTADRRDETRAPPRT